MKPGLDSINARISVRTYDPAALPPGSRARFEAACSAVGAGPFGHRPRFAVTSSLDGLAGRGGRIGTYGVIKGAASFIVGVVEAGDFACVDYGYCMEGLILEATRLGLGTCWVGGVFDRGLVKKALGAGKAEFCPAISPLGIPAALPGLQDRLIRAGSGAGAGAEARIRKDRAELFFEKGEDGRWLPYGDAALPGGPAPDAAAGASPDALLAEVLEAVRIGPSASNKQPWRVLVDRRGGNLVLHLFMGEDRLYNNMLGAVKLQELDMGIAMRHVDVASAALGLSGAWRRLDAAPAGPDRRKRYIASWTAGV
jgi:nitroreductase